MTAHQIADELRDLADLVDGPSIELLAPKMRRRIYHEAKHTLRAITDNLQTLRQNSEASIPNKLRPRQ